MRVLALPGEDASWLQHHGVAVYRGDVREPASLTQPVDGADAVLHLAAMMDVWRPLEDYRAVNVTGTENMCRAALAAGVRRFVHMSSSSVYGIALGRPADESFPLAPFGDPYPVTKAAGDRLVQRMIDAEHLPAVIIRPDQIFGPGDELHFGHMADRLRAGRGILVGSGNNAIPLVYVADVVQGTAARPGPRSRARPGLQHHQRPAADPEAAAARDRRGDRGQPAAHPGALPCPVRSRVPEPSAWRRRRRP